MQEDLESEDFQKWCLSLGERPMHMHRKVWEWCYITQALHERGLLRIDSRGLGFAVGQEPLASFFASRGATILATDLWEEVAEDAGWVDTDQHASGLESLNSLGLCPPELFRERVSFRNVDMNQIPNDLIGFDFVWSACALEHLGSLEFGAEFIFNSMTCLRPGGIAVHTTEYNVSSNTSTVDDDSTVLYRRIDLESIVAELREAGHRVQITFEQGTGDIDEIVDVAPYSHDPHLKLQWGQYVITSFGLIVQKGAMSRRSRFSNRLSAALSRLPTRAARREYKRQPSPPISAHMGGE
jgi:2-polyprenyl-3-methyl-5-hydroxy-6-metoxy-1,4-benzoquinol methylase